MPITKNPNELSNIETLPPEIAKKINWYIPAQKKIDPKQPLQGLSGLATASSYTHSLFAPSLMARKLLGLIFMGQDGAARKLILKNPNILFERETYKMPLLDNGQLSEESEQIFHEVTPLELLFYTGDFKMWDMILPIIPKKMIENVLTYIQIVKRGGPDLVRIDFDPRSLDLENPISWEKLKYFDAGLDSDGNSCIYNLLSNPDGILCCALGHKKLYFYANPENRILELLPELSAEEDRYALNQLQQVIDNEMIMNSSRRTSDTEHALIQKIFGKTLVRNGLHYEFRRNQYQEGVHYHDTYDGCDRLINAYRQYLKIVKAKRRVHTGVWSGEELNELTTISLNLIGQAQRYSMPNIIQRFLEKGTVFFPLPKYANILREREFMRVNRFSNQINGFNRCYPFRTAGSVGANFILYKGKSGSVSARRAPFLEPLYWWLDEEDEDAIHDRMEDLPAVCKLANTSKECLDEWQQKFTESLTLQNNPMNSCSEPLANLKRN